MEQSFIIKELTSKDIEEMIEDKVIIYPFIFDPYRLKMLHISYYDFEKKAHHDGKMVVMDAVAAPVINIFKELYLQQFPINQIKLMNEYQGIDELSLEANNSSCLNQRIINRNGKLSLHSYGVAIDINPIQNPVLYPDLNLGNIKFSPIQGIDYINRTEDRWNKPQRPGMVEKIKSIFVTHGFNIWGGDWDNPIDYHHFQISRQLAEFLIKIDAEKASIFFKLHINFLKKTNFQSELLDYLYEKQSNSWLDELSNKNTDSFIEQINDIINSFI